MENSLYEFLRDSKIIESRIMKSLNEEVQSLYTSEQKDLFDRIQPGDIVYCAMPLNEHEKKTIKKGHEFRPYLILKKLKDSLIGLPCTSKNHEKSDGYYKITRFAYHSNKKTSSYINIMNPTNLTIDLLRNYMFSLDYKDFSSVKEALIKFDEKYNLILDNSTVQVRKGNIVQNKNQLYYIFDGNEENFKCFLARRRFLDEKDENAIMVDAYGKKYFIYDTMTYEFQKNQLEFVDTLHEDDIKYIDNKHSIYVDQNKLWCRYPIGTLFVNDNKKEIMYLYSDSQKDYGIQTSAYFTVDKNNKRKARIQKISIEKYYLDGRAYVEDIIDVLDYYIRNEADHSDFLEEKKNELLSLLQTI